MLKIVPYPDIMVVQNQAFRDGHAVGRNHRGLNVTLERKDVEGYARLRSNDSWKRIQLGMRELHTTWTGHKPEFLQYYQLGFLLGYAQAYPNAYEAYLFPETPVPVRSTKAQRKYLRRVTKQESKQESRQKASSAAARRSATPTLSLKKRAA